MKNWEVNSIKNGHTARLRAVIRHSFFVISFGIFCLLGAVNGRAQSSNRWLLVFNTSAAMRDRVPGVETVVQDLLNTAMHGNARAGDTIGIWTYDNELRADEAPLLTWDADDIPSIKEHTFNFVEHHLYQKKSAAFSDVLTNMIRVIGMSDTITVILFSDGEEPIKGTPFDARINAFYRENDREQRKAHMPFITVFRGEGGQITTNTLDLAPSLADIPAIPLPVIAKIVPPKPAPPAKPAPLVPSLVMIGTKSETVLHPLADYASETTVPPEQKSEIPKPDAPAPAPEPPTLKTQATPKTTEIAPVHSEPAVAETPKPAESTEPVAAAATAPATTPLAAKSAAPPVQIPVTPVAALPSPNFFSARNIAIAAVALAAFMCILLIATARRARNLSRASLITRSLEREAK